MNDEKKLSKIRMYIELLKAANIAINQKTEFEFRSDKCKVRVETIGFQLEEAEHEEVVLA